MKKKSTGPSALPFQAPENSQFDGQGGLALIKLGRHLRECEYRFTAVTPATHARVNARAGHAEARDLRGVFGWNRPFRKGLLTTELLSLMEKAGILEIDGPWLRSTVRFATLDDLLLLHSSYPTLAADSVFFGPDSYRFGALIRRVLSRQRTPVHTVVDIGCGSGVGGLIAARASGDTPLRLVLADINHKALAFAQINARLNGYKGVVEFALSDVLASVTGPIDLIVANPPYLSDPAHRTYRDGGGDFGYELSLRIARESLERLAPGGRLVLYTGTAVVDGIDLFKRALASLPDSTAVEIDYFEIDPDVFGEELETPCYASVERLAVVGLVARKAAQGGANPSGGGRRLK